MKEGIVLLLGRPNVGKSTFVNNIIGQKVAITSPKPQTTRFPIQGLYEDGRGKIIFTDNAAINLVCRSLGAPRVKLAGIYLNKEFGVRVKKGERLFTLYAEDKERLKLGIKALEKMRIYKIS